MSEKIYRDSVHNIIRLKTDTDEGKLLVRLIDTAEFQRLRRIKQLGLAHFAYQAAEHSRFTHSIGALHLATRILAKLELCYEISDESKTAVRCAALLHDIGHGAFSHVIETILNFHHEEFTIEAVLSNETEVGQVLKEFSADLPESVASIIRGDFRPAALAGLVSSQLDVDRMDYLLRDSLMTGAKYGIYDLEWIIKSLEIDEENDRLYVSARGIYATEDYLQARYYMFRQVYFHRTLRAAETVLRSLIKRALDIFADGKDVWFAANTPFEKILKGEKLSLKEHLDLDDSDVMFHIKQWQSADDKNGQGEVEQQVEEWVVHELGDRPGLLQGRGGDGQGDADVVGGGQERGGVDAAPDGDVVDRGDVQDSAPEGGEPRLGGFFGHEARRRRPGAWGPGRPAGGVLVGPGGVWPVSRSTQYW